jgi:thiosulfate/3-mercaptopyruvate sulfurtransferase
MKTSSLIEPLISATDLAGHIGDPDWVVVDCRFNLTNTDAGRAAYAEGHIPGAVYADLDQDLAGPVEPDGTGGRHPLPAADTLGQTARDWGVNPDSVLVAYDDAGGALAARLWWLMRWAGHPRVAVLDGGFSRWIADRLPLETHLPRPAAGTWQAVEANLPTLTANDVAGQLATGALALLDARAEDRFAGRVEPLDTRAGHIPGARNVPFTVNLGADKCFRSPPELQAYYRAVIGDRPMEEVAGMCGSGVTACHTLLALERAGLPGAALYVGSWSDWISDPSRPVATDD